MAQPGALAEFVGHFGDEFAGVDTQAWPGFGIVGEGAVSFPELEQSRCRRVLDAALAAPGQARECWGVDEGIGWRMLEDF